MPTVICVAACLLPEGAWQYAQGNPHHARCTWHQQPTPITQRQHRSGEGVNTCANNAHGGTVNAKMVNPCQRESAPGIGATTNPLSPPKPPAPPSCTPTHPHATPLDSRATGSTTHDAHARTHACTHRQLPDCRATRAVLSRTMPLTCKDSSLVRAAEEPQSLQAGRHMQAACAHEALPPELCRVGADAIGATGTSSPTAGSVPCLPSKAAPRSSAVPCSEAK